MRKNSASRFCRKCSARIIAQASPGGISVDGSAMRTLVSDPNLTGRMMARCTRGPIRKIYEAYIRVAVPQWLSAPCLLHVIQQGSVSIFHGREAEDALRLRCRGSASTRRPSMRQVARRRSHRRCRAKEICRSHRFGYSSPSQSMNFIPDTPLGIVETSLRGSFFRLLMRRTVKGGHLDNSRPS
jgi:hypothetical protein